LRQSGSLQPQSPRERTSVSLPPREEPRNSFAERRSSRRRSSMRETEIVSVEASVEEDVAFQQAAGIMSGVRRSNQDATASPEAKTRRSTTEATPSPKERRRSLQPPLVVGGEGDHAEAAHRRQSHVAFEVDGLGIVDPAIQKSALATQEDLTPPSTADVDTPSKVEPSSADDDNDDNDDYSHEETGVKEAQGVVEQDFVAEQNDVASQGDDDDDDDYNDDYNADAHDKEVSNRNGPTGSPSNAHANAAVDETMEGKQAALDDYLEECY